MVAKLPRVFLYREDEVGCGCAHRQDGGVKETKVKMHVEENNVLRIELPEYRATPKLGDASEIEVVRVHIRKNEVMVYAIYADPIKTALNSCYIDSGCTCYAAACYS